MLDLEATFDKFEDEYLRFERIPESDRPSQRPDLCAFIRLDKLCPGSQDIVSQGEHDEIFLDVETYDLAKVATEDDILFLCRCGVMFNSGYECLMMFT